MLRIEIFVYILVDGSQVYFFLWSRLRERFMGIRFYILMVMLGHFIVIYIIIGKF